MNLSWPKEALERKGTEKKDDHSSHDARRDDYISHDAPGRGREKKDCMSRDALGGPVAEIEPEDALCV